MDIDDAQIEAEIRNKRAEVIHSSLKKGVLSVILKQAEMSVEEFLELL